MPPECDYDALCAFRRASPLPDRTARADDKPASAASITTLAPPGQAHAVDTRPSLVPPPQAPAHLRRLPQFCTGLMVTLGVIGRFRACCTSSSTHRVWRASRRGFTYRERSGPAGTLGSPVNGGGTLDRTAAPRPGSSWPPGPPTAGAEPSRASLPQRRPSHLDRRL
jgi:hypothetical protein